MTYVLGLVVTNSNVPRLRPRGAGWRQIAAATPGTSNRLHNVAAMIHRQATFQKQPVWTKRNHPPTCHSEGAQRVEESSQAASFTLCWFIEQRGGFLRSLCSVGMTYVFGFGRYKFKCTTIPAPEGPDGGRLPPLHWIRPL